MTKMTKKKVYRGKNTHFKPLWAIFLVLAILCITPITAEELLTFDNIKVYDDVTQTVTIVNTFGLGRDIVDIKLNTPLNYHVGAGYQKVAEFDINLYDDTYTNAFDKMDLYNVAEWEKIDRQIDYKYKTIETVGEDIYEEICDKISINGTKICHSEIVKTIYYNEEVWKELDLKTLIKGNITIGLFTDVQVGDYVEWIPTLFGVKIEEWASWTADLTVGLVSYYTLNGTTGDVVDSLGVKHSTLYSGERGHQGVSSRTNNSFYFDGVNDYVNNSEKVGNGYTAITLNAWAKPYVLIGTPVVMGQNDVLQFGVIEPISGNWGWMLDFGDPRDDNLSDVTVVNNTWYMLTLTYDGTSVLFYVDAVLKTNNTQIGQTIFSSSDESAIGGWGFQEGNLLLDWTGFVDEFSYWNRSLSSAEITQLWNDGNGMSYKVAIVTITLLSPIDDANLTDVTPVLSANITNASGIFIENVTINVYNASGNIFTEINTSGIPFIYNFTTSTLIDGSYDWNVTAYGNDSTAYSSSTHNFTIDTVSPALVVTYPSETITFHELNTNLSLNWSANDTHIGSCWYNWNGTNVSVTCADNTTNILITDRTNTNLTFYVNDTFGHLNSSFVSWNYRLFLNSETYDSEVFEGLSSTFYINLLTNGSDITAANFSYNNTNYLGTISDHGSNNFTLSRTITAPTVTTDTNLTFYWNITQGTLNYNLTGKNQTVINLAIDNCTTNSVVLYNFTIRNEENLTKLSSATTTARINLQIYGFATTNLIQEYNKTYTNINPFAVCLNDSLSTGGAFSNDVEIQYEADGYVTELYYIQNETITSASFNQNISLYDLNSSDSQVFKIIFRDSSFLPVENALIKIYRKYVDEGLYRVVEIPKTDKRGETVAHLVLNEVIYKLEVVKYGEILETFTDVIAVCQTPLVASCEIDLNAFSEAIVVPDFEDAEDFSFTLGYDNDTRIVSSVFTIPSGSVQTISLNVTREDSLGTAVCTDTLLSSSGTLSCVVPTSFGNSTIVAKIYKEGVLQAQGQIKLNQTPFGIYGVNLVFLALFIIITLIGAGMSDNPIYTTIFLLVGVALLFALNLVANNGFIGATATILFLVMAVVLIIIKGSRRN